MKPSSKPSSMPHDHEQPPEKGRRTFRMTGPIVVALALFLLALLLPRYPGEKTRAAQKESQPPPLNPLEELLLRRRSVRTYGTRTLSEDDLRRLCWSAQGITEKQRGLRAAPSAGALYPLSLYVATPEAVRRYRPETDSFSEHIAGDIRGELSRTALRQESIASAPAVFIIAANVAVTERRYGERAERYVWMEVGHAAQNLLLQAVALDLAGVPVGAFNDEETHSVLQLPDPQRPAYLIPVGKAPALSAPGSNR